MGSNANHTPITGSPDVRTALNTALGELDAAISNIGAFNVAMFGDSESDSTDAALGSSSTWNQRDLAGIEQDSDGIVTISTNQFTPAAGTYILMAVGATQQPNGHRMRLYNVTGAAAVFNGVSGTSTHSRAKAPLMCIFTANGSDAYRIDHYTNTAGRLGLDDASTIGVEVYCEVVLMRVGV